MWTDKETHCDLIGFRVHVDLIRSVITDPTLLPVTIGLFADWGGGKTSLMRMLEHDLNPENHDDDEQKSKLSGIACLYFNGWLFEGYDDAKSAILSSVLIALGEHKRFGPKLKGKAASLLGSVNWMRVTGLGLKHVALPAIAAYATGGASLVPSFIQSMGSLVGWPAKAPPIPADQADSEQGKSDAEGANSLSVDWEDLIRKAPSPTGPMDIRSFREQFAEMLAESDIDQLIVLIDDLDRCSPERIIENLEAIKLFLNVDKTAFVIGADPRIVRHAIAWKYRDHESKIDSERSEEESGDRLITDYLEKLIQFPYHLPRLSPAEIETYMVLLFCERYLDDEQFQSVVAACNEQRSENRYAVFGSAAVKAAIAGVNTNETDKQLELAKALTFCAAVAPLVTEGLKGNPRQVKRFLNAFAMRKQLACVANLENIDDAVLVKLMLLEYVKERHFRQLYNWQADQQGHPDKIIELEKVICPPEGNSDDEDAVKKIDDKWGGSWTRRWIAMEPSLVGVDLRDYFWVTRDRLQSTLSGLSMVPPIVRQAFDGLTSGNPGKQKCSVDTIRDLGEDDIETLFGLIEQRISKQLSKKNNFDVLRKLIEANVSGAAKLLNDILIKYPDSEIPPAVGGDLVTLSKSKAAIAKILQPAIDKLKESDSRVGRMVTKTLNPSSIKSKRQ